MRCARRGRRVRVIGIAAEHETVERAERVLRAWAAVVPGEPGEGLTVSGRKSKQLALLWIIGTASFWHSTEGLPKPRNDQWNYNVFPKQRSPKGSRLMTTQHGGQPGLPRPETGLEALRRRPRSVSKVEAKSRGFFVPHLPIQNAAGTKGGVRHDSAKRCGKTIFSYLL